MIDDSAMPTSTNAPWRSRKLRSGRSGRLRQPATPRHFEVWYTYATGYNPSLNQTINEMLARNGTL